MGFLLGAIKSVGFQPVAHMNEPKYGKTMISSIVPVFRFAHTYILSGSNGTRIYQSTKELVI
nr:hypothetical protein [Coxiella burnetii]